MRSDRQDRRSAVSTDEATPTEKIRVSPKHAAQRLIGSSFYLPEITPDLPLWTHPHQADLRKRVLDWSREFVRFGSADDSMQYVYGTMGWGEYIAGRLSFPAAELFIEWAVALFAQDDVAAVPELGGGCPRDPGDGRLVEVDDWTGEALNDLWQRTVTVTTPAIADRIKAAIHVYFAGRAEEVPFNVGEGPLQWLGWEAYLRARRGPIGIYVCIALAHIDMDVSDEVYRATADAADMVSDHVVLVNDVFSLRKELLSRDCVNAAVAYMLHTGVDLQEAVSHTCRRIRGKEHDFAAERSRLELAYTDIGPYLDFMGLIMAGNQRWSYTTIRYHGRGHVWNGLTSAIMELRPDRTVFHPLQEGLMPLWMSSD